MPWKSSFMRRFRTNGFGLLSSSPLPVANGCFAGTGRSTLEAPGGHREQGESIDEAAARELREETGALQFRIQPVCAYSVTGQTPANRTGEETFGMLYWAEIECFAPELHSEIAEIFLMDELPENWTYPEIQPKLLAELRRRGLAPANSNPSKSTGIGPKKYRRDFLTS